MTANQIPNTQTPNPKYHRTSPAFLRWLLIIGVAWGQVALGFSLISDHSPETLTLFFSIELSGLYTYLLYRNRHRWMPRFAAKPFRGAVLVGIFNAVVIETLFLVIEKIFGAQGVAAHPNLLIDLALTMPWYIGMVYFFARIQERYQYSDAAVLLIGGVFELGADGIVGGQVMPILFGTVVNLVQNWIFLLLISLWQFILVYSSMLLPVAWLLNDKPEASYRKWIRWSRPLLWLIPFTVYLIAVMLIFFVPG
ncbi:hypothetical protein KQH61_04310 [bacterium]|nr:hypothetical protein [bacterium]MCB2179127.1 hypothetical protein [bacterium]